MAKLEKKSNTESSAWKGLSSNHIKFLSKFKIFPIGRFDFLKFLDGVFRKMIGKVFYGWIYVTFAGVVSQ